MESYLNYLNDDYSEKNTKTGLNILDAEKDINRGSSKLKVLDPKFQNYQRKLFENVLLSSSSDLQSLLERTKCVDEIQKKNLLSTSSALKVHQENQSNDEKVWDGTGKSSIFPSVQESHLANKISKPLQSTQNLISGKVDLKEKKMNQVVCKKPSKLAPEKARLKKKKFINEKKFKLSDKKSVMSKFSETADNVKIKKKKSKLKTTNSKSTVILKIEAINDKKNEKLKRMKNDKYIYLSLNRASRKDNSTINSQVVKNQSSENVQKNNLTRTADNKNEQNSMVKSKTKKFKNEQINTEIIKNDIINTKKEVKKEINKIIIAKVPTNCEKKISESESSMKKEQRKSLEPRLIKKDYKKETIFDMNCSPINEKSNEDDKAIDEKQNDSDFVAPKNYEIPTTASKLKQADKNYYNKCYFSYIPFIAGTSLAPSHNLGLNVQQLLGLMKNEQMPINNSTRTLFRKIGKGVQPISSLWTEIQQLKNNESKYNNNYENPLKKSESSSDVVWESSPNININKNETPDKLFVKSKSLKPLTESLKKNDNLLDSKDTLSIDENKFKSQPKSIQEIKNMFIKIYKQFEELQSKYEKLLIHCDNSNSPALKQELADLEKKLCLKEEEINVFLFLYQELKDLKKQVRLISGGNSLVCISEAYSRMQTRYNSFSKLHSRPSTGFANIQLLTMLKKFQTTRKINDF